MSEEANRIIANQRQIIANLYHIASQRVPQVYEYHRNTNPLVVDALAIWTEENWQQKMEAENEKERIK